MTMCTVCGRRFASDDILSGTDGPICRECFHAPLVPNPTCSSCQGTGDWFDNFGYPHRCSCYARKRPSTGDNSAVTTRNLVAALSPDRRNHLLRKSIDAGDRVRQDRRNPEVWLVSSATYDNVSYRVRDGQSCGCYGFKYRGMCRHLVRVSWELFQLKKQAEMVAA